jgi:hypothetical protein
LIQKEPRRRISGAKDRPTGLMKRYSPTDKGDHSIRRVKVGGLSQYNDITNLVEEFPLSTNATHTIYLLYLLTGTTYRHIIALHLGRV